MLSMADTDIKKFFPIFASMGVPVAFLVPTPTGYGKSIMDATSTVREFLRNANIHDYTLQNQGEEYKKVVESYFVGENDLYETTASLYRPITKHGDPRIWFRKLRKYCSPFNLLALIELNKKIYVINLSNSSIVKSLYQKEFVYDILKEAAHKVNEVAVELKNKIQAIHDLGFLPSITPGDPGVGDTLENALGIKRNNSKSPDYKGIELKTTRLTRNGTVRSTTRVNLFARVPDEGMTYRQILDTFGKVQIPKKKTEARMQIYDTLRVSRPNAYDLLLAVDGANDKLNILYERGCMRKYVSSWYIESLRKALLLKHKETFWVKALSENHDGREYFRYDKILHTNAPNASLIVPLIEVDKITVDLAAHYKSDGKVKDHGMLFKMWPDDLPLLVGNPIEYDLTL